MHLNCDVECEMRASQDPVRVDCIDTPTATLMNPPKTHCATYDYDYALNALRDEVNDAKPSA
eukprot:scaffold37763_cov148-Skeletonema_marinoi.AAC.2